MRAHTWAATMAALGAITGYVALTITGHPDQADTIAGMLIGSLTAAFAIAAYIVAGDQRR
jgi:hypothetical protein